MTQSKKQARRTESGFTLVELAIVMIIIGLLIGGILKGQELITNARVSSTVAQVKAVESGISGFRDKYAALPGDLRQVTNRLPNATTGFIATDPATGTGNDGVISNTGSVQNPGLAVSGTSESGLAFIHLAAAGLVGGVQPSTDAVGPARSNPTTPLGGAWTLGSSTGTATGVINVTGLTSGVYMMTSPSLAAAVPTTAVQVMTPSNAANIDRKLDDGLPLTGIVRAVGQTAPAAGNCTNTIATVVNYDETGGGTVCGVMAKVQ